jgi:hypothetical protein
MHRKDDGAYDGQAQRRLKNEILREIGGFFCALACEKVDNSVLVMYNKFVIKFLALKRSCYG